MPAHPADSSGHLTVSPTLQYDVGGSGEGGEGVGAGGVGDGDGGFGDGEGGVGVGAGGVGEGDGGVGEGPGFKQSDFFIEGQQPKFSSAEGQVEPSGQHVLPLQPTLVPGHVTGSPTLHEPPYEAFMKRLAVALQNHWGTAATGWVGSCFDSSP